MDDFISREAAIKVVCDCSSHTCKMGECFNSCNEAKALSSIPAADVMEVRHGRWYLDNGCAYCSECKNSFAPRIRSQALFCPRCGAKMLSSTNAEAEWQYKTMSVPGGKGQTYAKWSCSACKGKQTHRSRYCPNCGKRMRNGGQD